MSILPSVTYGITILENCKTVTTLNPCKRYPVEMEDKF